MIICVCNAVTENRIRKAIDAGVDSFDALQFELGVALGCGKCEETVREILHAHLNEAAPCAACQLFSATESIG